MYDSFYFRINLFVPWYNTLCYRIDICDWKGIKLENSFSCCNINLCTWKVIQEIKQIELKGAFTGPFLFRSKNDLYVER